MVHIDASMKVWLYLNGLVYSTLSFLPHTRKVAKCIDIYKYMSGLYPMSFMMDEPHPRNLRDRRS